MTLDPGDAAQVMPGRRPPPDVAAFLPATVDLDVTVYAPTVEGLVAAAIDSGSTAGGLDYTVTGVALSRVSAATGDLLAARARVTLAPQTVTAPVTGQP